MVRVCDFSCIKVFGWLRNAQIFRLAQKNLGFFRVSAVSPKMLNGELVTYRTKLRPVSIGKMYTEAKSITRYCQTLELVF